VNALTFGQARNARLKKARKNEVLRVEQASSSKNCKGIISRKGKTSSGKDAGVEDQDNEDDADQEDSEVSAMTKKRCARSAVA
jgi:hypothetical protein